MLASSFFHKINIAQRGPLRNPVIVAMETATAGIPQLGESLI